MSSRILILSSWCRKVSTSACPCFQRSRWSTLRALTSWHRAQPLHLWPTAQVPAKTATNSNDHLRSTWSVAIIQLLFRSSALALLLPSIYSSRSNAIRTLCAFHSGRQAVSWRVQAQGPWPRTAISHILFGQPITEFWFFIIIIFEIP